MDGRQRILFVALLALAAVAVYSAGPRWLAWIAPKTQPARTVDVSPLPAQPAPPAAKERAAKAAQPTRVAAENRAWGRNPFLTEAEAFKPAAPAGGEAPLPTVRAIIMGRPTPVATIDGRVVAVGDKVGEERVVEIREDAVVLAAGRERRILRLAAPSAAVEVKEGNRR